MFVFNGIEYPLDMDSLSVNERINKAVRKMQRAMKSAEGKPASKYQQHVVAALKTWCNETFADDSAGEALLGCDSFEKVLETAVAVGVAIGKLRATNAAATNTQAIDNMRKVMAIEGMTPEQVDAAVQTFEQATV